MTGYKRPKCRIGTPSFLDHSWPFGADLAMKDLVSKEDYGRLIQDYDTWVFDCDGVLWHGDNLIEGTVEVLSYLRSQSSYRLILSMFVNHHYIL